MNIRRLIIEATTDTSGRVNWLARLELFIRYWRFLGWIELP